MDFTDYIANALPITLLVLLAAIVGTIFLKKIGQKKTSARYFVIFLWVTFFFEIFASYAPLAYFSKFEYFGFVKDTKFETNYWAFNIYLIFSYLMYITYFKMQLIVQRQRQILNFLLVIFLVSSMVNLLLSSVFFEAYSAYTNIVGMLVLLLSIAMYYFKLVRSDEVLKIGRLLPFYISIGAVILHLCLTPFFIYSSFFRESVSKEFVGTYLIVLRITNLLVYSIYIFGFIICRKNKSLY